MIPSTPPADHEDDLSAAQQLRLLADNLPALIAYFTVENLCCRFANEAYAKTYGFDTESIVGKSVQEVIGVEAYAAIRPYIDRLVGGETVSYERELTMPDGEARIIEVNLLPHVGALGKPSAAFVLIHDITKHRLAEKAIRDSEERLLKFADATSEAIVFFEGGVVTDMNDAAARLVRLPIEQAIGRQVMDFVAPESVEMVVNNIHAGFERPYEGVVLRADGTTVAAEFVGKSIVYRGKTLRMTVIRDISDRKQAEARIQFLAHHDMLTHLPNRAMLMDRLQVVLAGAKRQGKQVGILFIDLDDFKAINDSLGHFAGDQVLKRVAQRLQSCLRGADLVGRLGGDEFLVAITDLDNAADIAPIAEKIAQSICEPVSFEDQVLTVSGSIGISVYPQHGESPDALIRNADAAMYLAKEDGRNSFRFFVPGLAASALESLSMESGIRRAIRAIEFTLHYQPEVDTSSGKVSAVEALIRWKHPELGLLGPDKFISIAEHRGLIMPIGRWVLAEAVRQGRAWLDAGVRVPIAVNISAVQLKQKDLASSLEGLLREYDLPGELLQLEIGENLFMEDVSSLGATLSDLHDLGLTLVVDDFGTGYSSLSQLKRFPIDKIKIDRSFIRNIPDGIDDGSITVAIINLAASLGLRVAAGGVENNGQLAFLKRHRCDCVTGFLMSHPLPPGEMLAWLQQHETGC
ncbi:MAG TPA: EAL domain-containing protein [Usitatibacteraceae bacterium]